MDNERGGSRRATVPLLPGPAVKGRRGGSPVLEERENVVGVGAVVIVPDGGGLGVSTMALGLQCGGVGVDGRSPDPSFDGKGARENAGARLHNLLHSGLLFGLDQGRAASFGASSIAS